MRIISFEEFKDRFYVGDLTGNFRGDLARHTCSLCGRKRFERDMKPTGDVGINNFKAWRIWECDRCKGKKEAKS